MKILFAELFTNLFPPTGAFEVCRKPLAHRQFRHLSVSLLSVYGTATAERLPQCSASTARVEPGQSGACAF